MDEIVFNGVKYGSVDEMPPQVRRDFEKLMANVQDMPEGRKLGNLMAGIQTLASNLPVNVDVTTNRKVVVNTQKLSGPGELPPEMRKIYEDAMAGKPASSGVKITRSPVKFSFSFSTSATPETEPLPAAAPDQALPGDPSRDAAMLQERLRWAKTWIGILVAALVFVAVILLLVKKGVF